MMKNERGTTLIETIMAIGILGIVMIGVGATVTFMYSQRAQLVTAHSRALAVANQVSDIRVQASHYIKNYAPAGISTDEILNQDSLPIGVSPTYVGPMEGCQQCQNKMGFVIRPLQGFDGIFIATVRYVQSQENGSTVSTDLEFLVVPK